MFQQELQGRLRHRTEFHWEKVGRDDNGQRVVKIDGDYYFLGSSDGSESNCFIHALRQCLDIVANVNAIRHELKGEFVVPCGTACSEDQMSCTQTCTKVYEGNYLNTDHWESVLRLLGKYCFTGPLDLNAAGICIRVIELTWQANGVVLGNPSAPRRLTIARENVNHFVPVLRFRDPVQDKIWHPW